MTVYKSTAKKTRTLFLLSAVIASTLIVAACDLANNYTKIDRAKDIEVQDYRDALAPREQEASDVSGVHGSGAGVPPLGSYIAPVPEDIRSMPLVSVSVNQTVPLRDVLFELADQVDYDIELDPRIRGSIIFTARKRPFDVVIERIAEMAGLRYKFEDEKVRVELDTPYTKNYKLDYLNLVRTSESSIGNDVAVVSGEGADTGSSFSASNESSSDFWEELDANLEQILGSDSRDSSLLTRFDPKISAVREGGASVSPTVPAVQNGQAASEGVSPSAPQAVLRVDSLPVEGDGPGGGDDNDDKDKKSASYAISKQAGMISVYATQRQHKDVAEYLEMLRASVSSQVLIEAKVLEVSLRDEFSAGIDWSTTFLSNELDVGYDVTQGAGLLRPALDPIIDPASDFVIKYVGDDIEAGVEAMARFGTVRALASPRLTVLNNQSAVLNVADNRVYFEIEIDVTSEEGVTSTEITSEIKNVPEGVLINVMPSIDMETGVVSMAVRPTVTRIVDFVNDPGVAFVTAESGIDNIVSQIPVVNVQEMDSIISMPSGKAVVMGGLMQDRHESEQNAVPVLGELPFLGAAFRSQKDSIRKTELVIFLKATIIKNGDNIHPTDKEFYRSFSQDRRPARM